MTELVSSAAFAASKIISNSALTVKRSHLGEIVAAMLGYRTLAALKIEETDPSLDRHLGEAEMLVLNGALAMERTEGLLDALTFAQRAIVVQACSQALTNAADVPVYRDVSEFYDAYARDALSEAIASSDEVAGGMADTNASFVADPEVPDEVPPTDDLWAARTEWTIAINATMTGEYDPEGDRPFTGNTLNCYAKLSFAKAGRAGLVFAESEAYGGVDDSWREQDRQNEDAYWEAERLKDQGDFDAAV